MIIIKFHHLLEFAVLLLVPAGLKAAMAMVFAVVVMIVPVQHSPPDRDSR